MHVRGNTETDDSDEGSTPIFPDREAVAAMPASHVKSQLGVTRRSLN